MIDIDGFTLPHVVFLGGSVGGYGEKCEYKKHQDRKALHFIWD
jgi:hypothetical protein